MKWGTPPSYPFWKQNIVLISMCFQIPIHIQCGGANLGDRGHARGSDSIQCDAATSAQNISMNAGTTPGSEKKILWKSWIVRANVPVFCHVVKSLQLIWTPNTNRRNPGASNPQLKCSDNLNIWHQINELGYPSAIHTVLFRPPVFILH